jgi:hypothetical protein
VKAQELDVPMHTRLAAGIGMCDTDTWLRHTAARYYAAWFARLGTGFRTPIGPNRCGPQKVDKSLYRAAPAGFIGRVRVSLQSVVNAVSVNHCLVETILNKNEGTEEYVVSTLLLLVDSLTNAGYHKVAAALGQTPIRLWGQEELNVIELEGIARGSLHLEGDRPGHDSRANMQHVLVARLKTILGRDLQRHDVENELQDRRTATAAHSYSACTSGNCDAWTNDLYETIRQYVAEAVGASPDQPQSAEAFWATRAVWLGGGSSSRKIRDDPVLRTLGYKELRPTKNLLIATEKSDFLKRTLAGTPEIQARCATKNEPGMKKRPIRAADDRSYVVAAFASNNMEKYLSIRGSVMRQRPADVQATSRAVYQARALEKGLVVCIDYSDFNNTHTTRARALINLAFARAYIERGHKQQAAAALWMTRAQLNHRLDGELSAQGLSSGERDTARDNTILHWAYKQLILHELRHTRSQASEATTQICGDDEVAIGMSWAEAARYITTHAKQGHGVQRRKIMISAACGEFLQYNMYTLKEQRLPKQPLPPALNNFISGSWYKTAAYSQAAYPQQVAEAAASCVRRGAAPDTMAHLVAATCNWLCAGQAWRRKLAQTNAFYDDDCQAPKTITERRGSRLDSIENSHWPAINEYAQYIARQYQLNHDETATVTTYARNNVLASAEAALRLRKEVLEDEGDTQHDKLKPIRKLERDEEQTILEKWLTSSLGEHLDSETWMALQLGIPLQLVKKIGTDALLIRASNDKRRHIKWAESRPTERLERWQLAMLPGAILPAFTQ